MSLIQVKNYLRQAQHASLATLCSIFKAQPDTMRCLLHHLILKGCIRKCERQPACGTACFKCPVAATEAYEWL